MSDPAEDPFEAAAAAHAEGRLDEAAAGYEACLRRDPDDAVSMSLLGAVLAAGGDIDRGAELLERSTTLDRSNKTAWLHLGIVRSSLGDLNGAVAALEQALRLAPERTEAHAPLADCLARLGRFEEALRIAQRVSPSDPAALTAGLAAADSLRGLHRLSEAEDLLRTLLQSFPRNSDLLERLAQILEGDADPRRRLEGLNAAAIARGGDPEAVARLAVALGEAGRLEECLACWRQVEALRPLSSEPPLQIGRVLAVMGRREESLAAFGRSISVDPERADVWLALSAVHRFRLDDAETRALRTLADSLATRSDEDRCWLHYAMAKMHEDLREDEAAFAHHQAGAALFRSHHPSQLESELRFMTLMREAVAGERWRAGGPRSPLGQDCLFVVGMPRSGTTLVEQILASHPLVHGAGELRAAAEAVDEVGIASIIAAASGTGDAGAIDRLAQGYLRRRPSPGGPKVLICDKQPQNFRLLGPLALALPSATFIHVRRDPRDIGLSCFQAMFAEQPWSFDLREIGAYLNGYRQLMAHWDRCLADRIVTLRYESLVGDPEREIRALLDSLRLPFAEPCLAPHLNARDVNTASLDQVRRPISTASVGRWRRFEKQLQPLIDELGDLSGF